MENVLGTLPATPPTAAAIQDWLVAQLSTLLAVQPEEIDVREPFASYGLGSTELVTLSGELEEWLGRKLSPALAYEYPTIATLSQYLAGDLDAEAAASRDQATITEPIAIIGIGCRFPGAHGPEAFWELLRTGVDAITEVPPERFDLNVLYDPDPTTPGTINTRWGGFLEQVDQFDCHFFGISPREAARMDPQQRLLLEVAWEALEDAGQALERLAGTSTGVFIGIATNDYGRIQLGDPTLIDAYAGTGNALSIAANRLSYVFDFRGPSLAVDTACSSSLVAIHLACQSLRNGESTLALAGGVNLILAPDITINFTKAGALAPDGRCKAFDARANGFVRSEGVGVVVLKPLSRALAAGDPIYAVIRGSAVNQDGRSNGLMAPNPLAQEAVLHEAYKRAGVSPGQVQYVEAHGTGTFLGDPIEARALGTVLATERPEGDLCAIGSVKTNIGHLEAAAGVAGLIKVALALKHRQLPPSLHFQEPNPHIPFDTLSLQVQTRLEPWPEGVGPALAGVSSFGFGGTNAHVVLQEAPLAACETEQREEYERDSDQLVINPAQSSWLLPLSARSPGALQALARAYQEVLATHEVTPSLQDLCYTASVRRNHHDYRLAIAGSSREEFDEGLAAFLRGEARHGLASGRVVAGRRKKLVFVFPGHGAQWHGMGRMLLAQEPVFREALEQCDQVMQAYTDWSVLQELIAEASASRLHEVDVIQGVLFALQVALATLWRSWGVVPDAVVGHSMGEVAAAWVAGVLSLEDAARIICCRGHLTKRTRGQGAMVAVDLSFAQAQQVLTGSEDRVSIAASNSPTSTVLSGDPVALRTMMEQLQRQDIFCRLVNVDFASHSPQMGPLRADLLHALEGLRPHAASLPIYSTVTGTVSDGLICDATYWMRNLREPVLFSATVQRLLEDGHDIFVEISPHPILLGAIQQGLRHAEREGNTLPSLRREEDERLVMQGSLGALYALGYPVDWSALYSADNHCVSLPFYPWQRERCWLDTASSASSIRRAPSSHHYLPAVDDHNREENARVQELLGDWCYELQWHPQGDQQEPPPSPTAAGAWLIFADRIGVGEDFAALAKAAGEESVLVRPGETYTCLESGHYCLRPGHREDIQQLLTAVLGPDRPSCRGIIHLWSLDAPPAEITTTSTLETTQILGCGTALSLVQALGHKEGAGGPRLWLITQGAQAVEQTSGSLAIAQAPLWGFGRAVAQEHPTLWGGLVDLAPDASPKENAAHLWAALSRADGEDQLAFRQGRGYVARLMRTRPSIEQQPTFRWRPDGTYLITGGLGDLGLLVARWMVEQGARRLILLGRTQLPPRAAWREVESGSRLTRQIAAIRELEALGASIHLAAVDVADEARLRAFLDEFRAEGWPPIRGVVHLAGVVEGQPLLTLNPATFNPVLRPKTVGGWLLHCLLQDDPLDFFVLFSSAASLLGVMGQGQASYAAANAFLDALAYYRRFQGLPALSLNWGPWSQVGLAARYERTERLARRGIDSITPEQGLATLEQLFHAGAAQVVVMPVHWPRLRRSFPSVDVTPLFACLPREGKDAFPVSDDAPAKGLLTRATLLAMSSEERARLVQSYLRAQIARVLGLSTANFDEQQPLNTLGLDSLMAVELKNRIAVDLGVKVSVVQFLEGLSIEQVAVQVVTLLSTSPPATETSTDTLFSENGNHATAGLASDIFAPLSYGQRTMWFLCQFAPEVASYGVPVLAHIQAELDVPVLRRALQALLDRHAALRTTYTLQDGVPMQSVHSSAVLSFQEEDISGWSGAELKERLVHETNRPFDLVNGPLLRASLFTRSAQDFTLLLTVHHIAIDFWSLDILLNELRIFYLAEKTGLPAVLPPLQAQYTDYVAWQSRLIANEEGERLWAYWQQRLAGKLPVLALPTDRPRPPIQTYHGASYTFGLDEQLVEQLKELTKAEGVTLYMTLLAAFQVLLHRYTGQDDIMVGTPAVGRSRSEFEEIVGYFANPVPLLADLSAHPSFTQFLVQVRRIVMTALEHQDYPVELLVERLHLPRDPSRTALFQVFFGWDKPYQQKEQRATAGLAGMDNWINAENLSTASFALDCQVALLDLMVIVLDAGPSLQVLVQYNTDLFTAATIERMAQHFETLLQSIVAHPHQSVSSLPLLTAAEQHQLCVEWNSTQTPYPHDQCLQELFEAQVERTPEAVALVSEETHLSYRELNRQANQVAHHLRKLGVGPDTLVGLCMERSVDLFIGLLGILKAGGAYVPLDAALPLSRLEFILADTGVSVLLTQARLRDRLPAHQSRVVCLDTEKTTIAQESETNPVSEAKAQHLAYVIYTSGSTGTPKGVLVPHQAVVNHNIAVAKKFGLQAGDRILQFHSISFDAAVEELFPSWLSGAAVVLPRDGMPAPGGELLHLIEHEQLTVLNLPTAYWHEWVSALSDLSVRLPASLRLVVVGGEKVLPERASAWQRVAGAQVRWMNTYGPTETTVIATLHEPASDKRERADDAEVPIGRPLANVQVYILDERLQPIPRGMVGELYIGGVGLARGYLQRPDLTAEQFVPDPFGEQPGSRLYRTGDLARYQPDGTITFVGRRDQQVKIRGFRVELGEVETVLRRHPAVREAVVIYDGRNGSGRLVGYVVAESEQETSGSELRGFLQQWLPEYMVPATFVALDVLPYTRTGKVDRQALPLPTPSRPDLAQPFVAPRTPTEETLVGIWTEVLRIERVGIHDNFFELGGHSLLATQVMSRVRTVFAADLPLRRFFETPTVAGLAESLDSLQQTGQHLQTPPLLPVAGNGETRSAPEHLLTRISELSEAEVDTLLGELLAEEESH
jgi:amino acid adenylation domain-containing protein